MLIHSLVLLNDMTLVFLSLLETPQEIKAPIESLFTNVVLAVG